MLLTAVALLSPGLWPALARAVVRVADITRLAGQHEEKLHGFGLVVGLDGTGDGGDYGPAIRPLAELLASLGDPALPAEMKNADNVGLVLISATIPANGALRGDKIDVFVSSAGAAKSLKGGRLVLTPLQGPHKEDDTLYAWAAGAVSLPDPEEKRSGVVKQGARLEEDVLFPQYVADHPDPQRAWSVTLIINWPADSWALANEIAQMINEAEEDYINDAGVGQLAIAETARTVRVFIPGPERQRPAAFIARILALPVVMPRTEARVRINEKTGTIIITGDVELSPAIISHKDLTITTIEPEPQPSPAQPRISKDPFYAIDPHRESGTKLKQLLDALNQLKVPAADRIAIIQELYRTNRLHAELITE